MSEAQSLTTKLDAHADWLEHVKDMPKNAELIRAAVSRIKSLEEAVYHTAPGEMMFGGEGWTWKQQAHATEDRLKEAESELARRDKEAADARERVERE